MKLTFIGAGSAFNKQDFQTNMILEGESGKRLLIDCGTYASFALQEMGIHSDDIAEKIDAIYISHQHADHAGGLEEIAFCTYFNPSSPRIKLFCVDTLMPRLWESTLKGGLESLEGKIVHLTEYFDCYPLQINKRFEWDELTIQPVQTVHFMNGFEIVPSYGLVVKGPSQTNGNITQLFITTDTQFCPNQIRMFYREADVIFHDCETSPFPSGVHAHYDDLLTLPECTKKKIYLCHYQPNPHQVPKEDGFLGFVQKGQIFEF
ncbi:MBL fold hydrolase [Candidatus Heimdallarchaeota archaeon]|nr:MAG: MBL fold hydrolase [Candidatus Heimdallarchaeota archaeon]